MGTSKEQKLKKKYSEIPSESKLLYKKRKKKSPPRYKAQRWFESRWHFIKSEWSDIGSSNSLDEAVHLMSKTDFLHSGKARVIDITTGEVVATKD